MIQFGKGKCLLQLIDRKEFNKLCQKWEVDKGVRSLTSWEQTCTHVMSYILKLESLREVETVLFVPRSTLSDANARRSSGFFEDLCSMALKSIQSDSKDRKVKRAIKSLLAMDASECKVHGSLSRLLHWKQRYSKNKNIASLKLHAIWNVGEERVEDFRITGGRATDGKIGQQFEVKSGSVYVFDRAYNDLTFWWRIVSHGSHFVSRLKTCSHRNKHREVILRANKNRDGVLWDGQWQPTQKFRHPDVPKKIKFRYIIYRDPETKKVFDFITSDCKSSAQQISDLYKKRWAVELLFRWLKGHLNIRYFPAKTPNAIRIQLAMAILVQLLVQLHRIKSKFKGSLWECLRQLRMSAIYHGLSGSHFPADLGWNPLIRARIRRPANVN